nr:hypothetical protein [Tanacetum cinerariifolium]
MQEKLLKEKDVKIADLKARLSLKEAEAAKAIRLRCPIADVEASKAARVCELESLKERNVALESTAVIKDSTLAAEISATSAATVPFDTSSITPTPEHEGGKDADSVSAPNVRTKRPAESEFNVGAARQTCLSAEEKLLKEKDVKIADLKARLSLKEAEAAKAIRLRCPIADVEASKAARVCELESLKERNVALESTAVIKDVEFAKLS